MRTRGEKWKWQWRPDATRRDTRGKADLGGGKGSNFSWFSRVGVRGVGNLPEIAGGASRRRRRAPPPPPLRCAAPHERVMAVAESPGGATNGTVELYEIGGALGCTDSAKKQKTKKKQPTRRPIGRARESERREGEDARTSPAAMGGGVGGDAAAGDEVDEARAE